MSGSHYSSLCEVAGQIKAGEVSPVELAEQQLDRIERVDGTLQAYARVTADSALEQAQTAATEIAGGNYKGPLHGMPIAIKDLMDTAGVETAAGSIIRKGNIPGEDATVVTKLKEAGAVILGKLNMTEFALSGYHPDMPVPLNPWSHDKWSGVSSSGSGVATAAGLAYGTIGTDTGGSIRFPSAANGVVGIKPTFGLVSKQGAYPLADTLDHVGPITRRVADAASMLQAIAGYDAKDAFSVRAPAADYSAGLGKGVKGKRIGVDAAFCAADAHPEVTAAVLKVADVLADQGAEIVPVNVMGILETAAYWGAVVAAEAAATHAETFPSRASEYGPVFASTLGAAAEIPVAAYGDAMRAKARASSILETYFQDIDVLLCPSAPLPAMPTAEFPPTLVLPPEAVASFVGFVAPFNFTGHPTISAPCGFSNNNLPLSLQLVGRHFDEATLVQVADAYEQATNWHKQTPPFAE